MCARTSPAWRKSSSPSNNSSTSGRHASHFIVLLRVGCDETLHLGACAMQIRFHLRQRKTSHLRDLVVTQVLKNFQRENLALVVVELVEPVEHHAVQLLVEQTLSW